MAGNLTRIYNNQITNSTIVASQKIQAGTITGSLFASNVTVPGDFLITGNLVVLGNSTQTTIASTNTFVNDPLIVMNNGLTGTNTYDEGLLFNRGTSQNQAFIWNEFNQEFRFVGTTETGGTYGNVNQSNYANVRHGNLFVQGLTTVLYTLTARDIQNTPIGNATPASGAFTTLSATSTANVGALTAASINGTVIGNVTPASGDFTRLAATGIHYANSATTSTSTTTGGMVVAGGLGVAGNVYAGALFSGNGLVSTGVFTGAYSNGIIVDYATGTGRISVGSNAGLTIYNGGLANVALVTIGTNGNLTAISINATPIGNVTPASGDFTRLAATGIVYANSTAAASSTSTGALVVAGGVGIGGNVYAGGNIVALSGSGYFNSVLTNTLNAQSGSNIGLSDTYNLTNTVGVFAQTLYASSSVASTNTTSGALQVVGGAGIGGNLNVGGNFNVSNIVANGVVTINNSLTANGVINFTNTTNASSTTSGGALTVAGGAAIGKDLYVGGNIYVSNIVGVVSNTINVQDPLLYLQNTQQYPWSYDIGFYSDYIGNQGNIYQHTGLVKSHNDGIWYLVSNIAEPGAFTISLTNAIYDQLTLGNILLKTSGGVITDQTSVNIVNTTATTVNLGGAATSLNLGATSGTATINNANVYLPNASTIFTGQTTVNFANTVTTNLGIGGATTVLNLGGTSGSVNALNNLFVGNSVTATGNIAVNGGYVTTSATTFNLVNSTATTLNVGGAATALSLGATSGTATINNPTLSLPNASNIASGQTTVALLNNAVTTVNAFGAATTIGVGASTGTTTFNSTTASTSYGTGAIVSKGGVGVAGNLNVASGNYLTVGLDLVSNTVIGSSVTVGVAEFIANLNANTRVFNQNINSGASASSGFTAIANGGNTTQYYLDMGVTSSTQSALGGLIKPYDSFISAVGGPAAYNGGNLILSSGGTTSNIRFVVGSVAMANVSFNNFNVAANAAALSTTTAALTVAGGVGVAANMIVGTGATFNSTQVGSGSSGTFTIKGVNDSALFVATPGADSVVIGGQSNATPQYGTAAKFGGTGAIVIPIGTTAQRPSSSGNVDVAGMLRLNSSTGQMEYYNGSMWQVAGSIFTTVSDRQFAGNVAGGYGNVDGTNTTFTIQANATTASTLVSINGILQIPTLAYAITSGTTLTFTEAPSPVDVIDVRCVVTTATVSSLTSATGNDQFITLDGDGASIWTGSGSTTKQILVDETGTLNYLNGNKVTYTQTAVNVPTSGTAVVIDSFTQTSYSTAKYVIQVKNGSGASGNYTAMEALLVTDGAGNAYVTTYGIVSNGTASGTLSANVVSGAVRLYFTSTSLTNSNVKVQSSYIV